MAPDSFPASTVDRDAFLESLAAVCTPVAIVTSHHDGHPHGTTVSAFCSLSLDPPLVLVSLDRRSDLLAMVRRAGRYGINVLSSHQHGIARSFARKGQDKFEGVDWRLDRELPRIVEVGCWIVCSLHNLIDGGDHVIVTGLVEHCEAMHADPLLYRQRDFGTLAALPAA
jgi:flavin reductase (DIM6/NTAB) family NADH-FMN oxidoreductase RutF